MWINTSPCCFNPALIFNACIQENEQKYILMFSNVVLQKCKNVVFVALLSLFYIHHLYQLYLTYK